MLELELDDVLLDDESLELDELFVDDELLEVEVSVDVDVDELELKLLDEELLDDPDSLLVDVEVEVEAEIVDVLVELLDDELDEDAPAAEPISPPSSFALNSSIYSVPDVPASSSPVAPNLTVAILSTLS